ncbi:MAG: hypothetical protein H6671_16935 [Anaerolineaceae bacterium]|nr:hypothetical protein [Anaerolineaceae bacterium]
MRLPALTLRLRLGAISYGLLVFLWLSPEDNHVWPVAVLGAGLALMVGGLAVISRFGGRVIPRRWLLLSGALAGLVVGAGGAVAAAGLMLVKTALHSHIYPDYPLPLILAMLERAPAWGLAGLLVGGALALLWGARQPHTEQAVL